MADGVAYTRLAAVTPERLPAGWPASHTVPSEPLPNPPYPPWPPGWPKKTSTLANGAVTVNVTTDSTATVDQTITVDVDLRTAANAVYDLENHILKIVFTIDGTGAGTTATFWRLVDDVNGNGTQFGINEALDPGISDLEGEDRTLTCTVTVFSIDEAPNGNDTTSIPALALSLAGSCSGDNHVLTVTADAPYASYLLTISNLSGDASGSVADNGTVSPDITYTGTYDDSSYTVTFDVSAAAP